MGRCTSAVAALVKPDAAPPAPVPQAAPAVATTRALDNGTTLELATLIERTR